jgi:hypothetical protein
VVEAFAGQVAMQRRIALDSHQPSCRAPSLPQFKRHFLTSLQAFGYQPSPF